MSGRFGEGKQVDDARSGCRRGRSSVDQEKRVYTIRTCSIRELLPIEPIHGDMNVPFQRANMPRIKTGTWKILQELRISQDNIERNMVVGRTLRVKGMS